MTLKSSLRGIQARRRRHDALYGGIATYNDKMLATVPTAYWPQSETTGTTAYCLVNAAQNGTYTGVTLANDTAGPFGTPAPFYDGANDYCNIDTAAIRAAWDAGGAEWSILFWWKVVNAGAWADGVSRRTCNFADSANDNADGGKRNLANQMQYHWDGGGVAHVHNEGGVIATDWVCSVMTRSEAADEVKYYHDAALLATDTVIGNWASATPWTAVLIGAANTVPAAVWHGWLGPLALWPRALPLPEITSLSLQ